MRPGKKIATWHNDGTTHGRWEWEPGEGPPPRPWLVTVCGVALALAFWAGMARLCWWIVYGTH